MTSTIIVSSGVVSHNVTVTYGVTMEVLKGGAAVRTIVDSGGVQEVYGRALSTTVRGRLNNQTTKQIVESGGVVNYETIISGMDQINSSGIAKNLTISGADSIVYGEINEAHQDYSAMVVSSGGRVYNLKDSDGADCLVESGGLVSGVVASGVGHSTEAGFDVMTLYPGAYGRDIDVMAGADIDVFRGASVSGIEVESGAVVQYFDEKPDSAGIVSGVTVASGATINYGVTHIVLSGLTVGGPGAQIGDSLTVYGTGLVVGTYLASGALETLAVGGRDFGAEIAGSSVVSSGGRMRDATVVSGGYVIVKDAGAVRDITISSGGSVEDEARLFACDLLSGGELTIGSQTLVGGLTVHAGAELQVQDAHYVSAVVSSGNLYVYTSFKATAVELLSLTGDTSGLGCMVASNYAGGTDITFVSRGGDSIVHAAAGFAAPAAAVAEAAYSLQGAHAAVFEGLTRTKAIPG